MFVDGVKFDSNVTKVIYIRQVFFQQILKEADTRWYFPSDLTVLYQVWSGQTNVARHGHC